MPEDALQGQEQQDEKPGGFSPIETQEELDRVVKARVARAAKAADKAAEARFAEAVEKAALYDEMQEKGKTELERAVARAKAAEERVAGFERERERAAWAKAAGEEFGVDPGILRGSTEEEVRGHAEAVKAAFDAMRPYKEIPASGRPASASGGGEKDLEDMLRKAAGLKPKG